MISFYCLNHLQFTNAFWLSWNVISFLSSVCSLSVSVTSRTVTGICYLVRQSRLFRMVLLLSLGMISLLLILCFTETDLSQTGNNILQS